MSRLRALAAGALVAVAVFYVLSASLLRAWLGPVAVLPAYAAAALLAGALTYHAVGLVSRIADAERGDADDEPSEWWATDLEDVAGGADAEDAADGADADDADDDAGEGSGGTDPDVEEMLGKLKGDREREVDGG